ncbi:MAG TPA: hypothetical protein VG650_12660 [Mycobacteriales bacterium]|nr:hypothetical protein [Mycobacteriales bacterium]
MSRPRLHGLVIDVPRVHLDFATTVRDGELDPARRSRRRGGHPRHPLGRDDRSDRTVVCVVRVQLPDAFDAHATTWG